MKKIFTAICCLLAISFARVDAQNAPISTVGTVYSTATSAVVPITMNNFANVYSINLKIVYEPAAATLVNVTLGSGMSGTMSVNILKANPSNPDTMTLGWFAPGTTGITLPNGTTIFNLTFNKVANGTSNIVFLDDNNSVSCRFRDASFVALNDNPASTYYLPGSVTFISSGTAPVTKIGNAQGCVGQSISIPVKVDGFYQVGATSLTINYNPASLSNPSVNVSGAPFALTTGTSTPGVITVSGSSITPGGHTLPFGSTFFTLNFTYLGGNSNITFNISAPGNCDYGGPTPLFNQLNDIPEASFYLNGTVSCNTTAPTISCPQNQTLAIGPNCLSALPNYTSLAITSGICLPVNVSQLPAPGTVVSGGTSNTVTLTATDACGNTASCSFLVNTVDNTQPVAICTNPTIALNSGGQATLSVSQVNNGSYDDCSLAGIVLSKTTFDCSNVGANSVVMTVTDGSGNTNTCTSIVTVTENILPTALCQDVTVYLDALGQASVSASQINNGSYDNCGVQSMSLDITSFTCADLGIVSVTLTVQDFSGNTATCNANVTVADQIDPVLTCPSSPQTRQVIVPQTTYIAQGMEFDPVSLSDNCGLPIQKSNSLNGQASLSGYAFPIGSTSVTWTATDGEQNSSTCSFVVTVVSVNNPPVVICPQIIVAGTDQGICTSTLSSGLNATYSDPDNNETSLSWTMSGATSASSPLTGFNQIGSFTFNKGITTIIYKVTDAGALTSTCSFTVEINDNENPIAVCQPLNLNLDGNGQVVITPTQVDNGSSDNCGIASIQLSKSVFTCVDLGVNTVILTVTDLSGNTATCSTSITISDIQNPTAICKDITLPLNAQGTATLLPAQVDNGSSDNCSFTLVVAPNSFTCNELGVNMVTLTVTDGAGNSSTCTSLVTVVDNTGPVITCPASPQQRLILLTATDYPTQGSEFDPLSVSDNCGGTITLSNNLNGLSTLAGYLFPLGTTTVIWTATDVNSNSSTCSFNVEIIFLNHPPTIDCPGSQQVNTDQGLCVSTVSTGLAANYADLDNNVNKLTWTMTGATVDASPLTGINNLSSYTFNRGVTTILYRVTDDLGLFATCQFTVTVVDNEAPLAVCQNLSVQLDINGVATITPAQVNNGSTDNCGIQSLSLNRTLFGCGDVATNPNVVVLTVTDVAGNTATCIATVTVTDILAPNAICKNAIVILDATGNATLLSSQIDNGSTDNCGIQSYTLNRTAFTCADIATNPNTVVLTLSDVNGNTSTCSAAVTVVDNLPPTALCKNLTVSLSSNGIASITGSQIDNGSSDNCGVASLIANPNTFDCSNQGVNTVILTVTDVNGNTATCSSVVTVVDDISPTIVCPTNLTLSCASQLTVPALTVSQFAALPGASVMDNCPQGLMLSHLGDVISNQSCPNRFTITRTYRVTDAAGNSSSCSQSIQVNDITAPNIYCGYNPGILTILNPTSPTTLYTIIGDEFDPDSTNDACGGTVTLSNNLNGLATLAGFSLPGGLTTIIWTATDLCGNTATCSFGVYVNQYPTVTCPQSQTLSTDQGICAAQASALTPLSFSDPDNNLKSLTWVISGATTDASPVTGINLLSTHMFNKGISTITYVATDSMNLSSSCSFTITVNDNEAPSALCKNITLNLDASGNAGLSAAQIDNGSTDNCAVSSLSISPSSFTCAQLGANTVILTVSDQSGNTATCSATVTVVDDISPIAACQNLTLNLDATGSVSITAAQVNNGSTDNCSITNLSISKSIFTCADLGANTVVLSVIDQSGNSSTCTATITVVDNIAPTAICQNLTINLDATGAATITAAQVNNGSTDNCSITNLSVSKSTFTCADLGANTVVLTVSDQSGNSSTCSATITVVDNIAPTAICQNLTINLDATGAAIITAAQVNNGSTDNCSITNLSISQTTFTCTNLGTNTVVLTVSDQSGNSTSCTATITVVDIIAPTAICQNLTINLDATGAATITAAQVNNGSTDNCSITNLSISKSTFTCADLGANTVVLTVSDQSGNSSTCTATITVVDNIAPTAICQNLTINLDATGAATITAAQVNNGSFDNCTITNLSISQSAFTCANLGTNTVTLTVTDQSLNNLTCIAIVAVVDNIPPTAMCQNVTLILDASGAATLTAAQVNNGSTDNCTISNLSISKSTFTCADLGNNTVVLTVSDQSGNSSTCTATITVVDNTAPTIQCPAPMVISCAALVPAPATNLTQFLAIPGASVLDNCAQGLLLQHLSDVISNQTCPNRYTITRTYQISDAAGNSASCAQIITVNDITAPTIVCPNDPQAKTVIAPANSYTALAAEFDALSASDGCGGVVTLSNNLNALSTLAGYVFPAGSTQVIWTATDLCGNTATCSFNVLVSIGNQAPTISCPQNQTIPTDQGVCTAMVLNLPPANFSDPDNNIVSLTWTMSGATTASSPSTGINLIQNFTFNAGTTTIIYTVSDAGGLYATCSFTLTVVDAQAPTAICQSISVNLDAQGLASITAQQINNGSTDNCGISGFIVAPSTFTCANIGANTVILTVSDAAGNSATCSATVTVLDPLAPVAVCKAVTVNLDATGQALITAAMLDNGSSDNCGISAMSLSQSLFTCAHLGANTVTLTLSDASGNSSSCTAIVTIMDLIPPTAICKNAALVLDAQGNATLTPQQIDNGSTDNCSISSITVNPSNFNCTNIGLNTVVLTVVDQSGNSATCSAQLTISDNSAPVAICQNVTLPLGSNGTATLTAGQVNNGSTDNCGITSMTVSPSSFNCANLGPNTVVLTMSDASGNSSTCSAIVTVVDQIAPIAQCQNITVQLSNQGTATIIAAQIDNGSSDNCGVASITVSPSSFNCADLGTNTVVLTVSDFSGNSSTCTAQVMVVDNILPVALCRTATIYLDVQGVATLTAQQVDNGSSDNCGIASMSLSQFSFTCANIGQNMVVLIVTDVTGNSSACISVVNVLDTIQPLALCQNASLVLDANGVATLSATQINNGSSDNCGISGITVSPSSFTCANMGQNIVTLTVTDLGGNTATCMATVTVSDNTLPMAICKNAILPLGAQGTAVLLPAMVDNGSSDNCAITSYSVSPSSFTCANLGTNSVVLTVSDATGNTSTCSATVTVVDNIAPTAICQNVTLVLDANGSATLTAAQVNNGSTDNCTVSNLSVSPSTFSCANIGANTVILTVTDQSGNTSTCSATVTVVDNTAPTAICQNVTLVLDANGSTTLTAAQVNNGSTDNCTVSNLSVSPSTFSCANLGANTVILTVSDQSGNTSTCSATVTIVDAIAPTAICQNVTLQLDATGTAALTAAQVNNGSTDNCTVSNLSVSPSTFNCANIGANTVILTVSDQSGNTSTCSAIVTVVDAIAPTAICQNVTLQLNATGTATLTAAQVNNGSADNCTVSNLSVTPSTFSCANLGANTVILTVSDQSGNTSTCSAIVTVVDAIAPTAICQNVTLQLNATGTATLTGAQVNNGSTDNCTISTLSVSPSTFTCANLGANTVILTISDQSGNTSTCSAIVTVIDNLAPTAICQNVTLQLNATGTATLTAAQVNNGSTDNCTVSNLSVSPSTFSCANLGANTVILTVSDQSGNTSTCSAIVTVVDNIAPSAICQNVTLQLDATGTATLTAAQVNNGSTDNCTVSNLSVSPSTFSCANLGANTVILTVSDQSGNTSTCSATVMVVDAIAPTAICQNVTVQLNATGTATLTAAQVNNSSTDNCTVSNLSIAPSTFSCANLGANTVILTVSDQSGNTSTCSATVTVVDAIAPTAICQNVTVQLNATGAATLTAAQVNNGSTDNCTVSNLSVTPSTFSCANLGANTVILTVSDQSGNTSTCSAIVTVVDNIAPTAICQNVTVQLNANGTITLTAAQVNNGSTDNCTVSNLSVTPSTFSCANLGANTVILTVSDQSGNTSTCSATVTVVDAIAPTAICQNVTVQLNATGTATLTAAQVNNGSTDNCTVSNLSVSPSTFSCANLGANTVILTVSDQSGNTSTCSATVTVVDAIAPTAICQNVTVQLNATGTATLTAAQVNNGSTDNCTVSNLSVTPSTFSCANLGANTVILTVSDQSGNTSTCSATVTVVDAIAPTAICQNVTVQLNATGTATLTAAQVNNGSTDNCTVSNLSVTPSTFTCANLGANTVILTVSDQSGNTSTCSATVTVVDAIAPTAICKPATINLGANGTATLTAAQVNNGSTDNCTVSNLSVTPSTFTCTNLGANTVILTVSDQSGNTSTCSATVTVIDAIAPTAICHNVTLNLNASGSATLNSSQVNNGSTDNCSIAGVNVSPFLFNCTNLGANTVTLTVTDQSGNSSTCTAIVTIVDNIPPAALCHSVTLPLGVNGTATLAASQVNNGSTDNCGIAGLTVSPSNFTCSNLGTNTVVLTVTDQSGNSSTCTTIVTVIDNIAPMAICHNVTLNLSATGTATLVAAQINNGSTDNCSIASLNVNPSSFSCINLGANTVVLTVIDIAGNSSTCSATVTVVDNIPPTAICQNVTLALGANGTVSLNAGQVNNGSYDNCSMGGMSVSPFAFNCSNVGVNTVTLTVTDGSGNSSTCTASVTIMDSIYPAALCKNITVPLDATGLASITAAQIDNGSSDNCAIGVMQISQSAFTCANLGVNFVTLTVTDQSGNSASCTANVTIVDNMPPTAICKNFAVGVNPTMGSVVVLADSVDNNSKDNCSIVSKVLVPNTFTMADIGQKTVVLTVTDQSGNSSTCSATVTVVNNTDLPDEIPAGAGMNFTLFPNPSTGEVSIKTDLLPENGYIQISNLLGQVLYMEPQTSMSMTINLGALPPGIYNVRLISAQADVVRRLVLIGQ